MGGKDDDPRTELDKWLDAQRSQLPSLRELGLLDERDDLEKDLPNSKDNASLPPKGPFSRFKSFVDSNLGSITERLKNYPSNVAELRARMQQEREARRQEHLDIWRRWTGSEDSPDHIRLEIDRASGEERRDVEDATYMLLRESYERNQHVSPQKILELYQDNEWNFGALDQFAAPMLSFGGACYYKPETIENLPSTARWGWPAPRSQWLSVDWFRRDPYSPIRLEAHPDLSASGTKWRAAFEDLLCAKLDKPMISEEKVGLRIPYGRPQSTYHGPGLDWMLSLQCRGILPPQLPSLYKPISLFDGFDEVKRPRTVQFMHDIDQITSNKSARMYPLVRSDLNALMDEVAIKSGPLTEAKPLKVQQVQPIQTSWRVPETEADLYDEMPPFVKFEERFPKFEDSWLPTITGNREEDRKGVEAVVWSALNHDKVSDQAKWFETYYDRHGAMDLAPVILMLSTFQRYPEGNWSHIYQALSGTDVPIMNREPRCLKEAVDKFPLLDDAWTRELRETLAWMLGERMEECAIKHSFWDENGKRAIPAGLMDPVVWERLNEKFDETKSDERSKPAVNVGSPTSARPEVLSQLTTTQTTRLPDGTVTTKVVLKQRFADGREETHESVQETHEPTPLQLPKQKTREDKPKNKGWFWN